MLFFLAGAVYITRHNHVVMFALIAADLIFIVIRQMSRSSVYELLIDHDRIEWGWVGVRNKHLSIPSNYVRSIQFYKRHDGTGSIELSLANGTSAILPSDFTDKPETAAQIIAKLRDTVPNAALTVH